MSVRGCRKNSVGSFPSDYSFFPFHSFLIWISHDSTATAWRLHYSWKNQLLVSPFFASYFYSYFLLFPCQCFRQCQTNELLARMSASIGRLNKECPSTAATNQRILIFSKYLKSRIKQNYKTRRNKTIQARKKNRSLTKRFLIMFFRQKKLLKLLYPSLEKKKRMNAHFY